jgi:protein involved in polysaccharide export with SLBB domain
MRIKLLLLPAALLAMAILQLSAVDVTSQNLQNIIPVSVSVTGDVVKPGIYTLTTMNHVSEALNMANLDATQLQKSITPDLANTEISLPKVNLPETTDTAKTEVFGNRKVILDRQGQRQVLDLLKFYRLGDISQNPFLKDGDVIIVSPARIIVTVEGSVSKPGDYEYRETDTLKDLLDLALGVTEGADLAHVMLFRYKGDFSEFDKLEIDASSYPEQSSNVLATTIKPGDRILVPSNSEYRKAYKVRVTGKVKMPGMYYVNDNTTVYDLMVMSGGLTKEADLRNSFVYNRLVSENYDPDFERLSKFSYQQMTWLEYSYMRTKTRQLKGKYSIDMEQCWNSQGKNANLVLRDGDEIFIPELINGVWVAGQIRNPGLITWNKDMKWKDYLASAGGFANNRKSQGTRIIRVNSGNWVKPTDKIQINPGDVIFVPEKEERYLWDNIREIILITSQLLTVLVAVRTF